jgi:hypothetical protein
MLLISIANGKYEDIVKGNMWTNNGMGMDNMREKTENI